MVLAKNSFVLAKAPQKSLFWPKWLDFDKSCSKLSYFANLTFFWQKLLKTVFFDRNSFSLAKIHRATESKRQIGPKDQDGKPVQKNQNGKFVRMREIDELE